MSFDVTKLGLAGWTVPGVVTGKKELLTTKEKKVWAWEITVTAMGGTYSMQTRIQAVYNSVAEGQHVVAVGRFDSYNGEIRLALDRIEDQAAHDARLAEAQRLESVEAVKAAVSRGEVVVPAKTKAVA